MKKLSFATWNILGDQFDREFRLKLVSDEIRSLDFVALQEIVLDAENNINTSEYLATHSGMRVASCISGDIANMVTGEIQATAILSNLEIVRSNLSIAAPHNSSTMVSQEYKKYAAAVLRTQSGRQILVVSVHLPWGASNEIRRIEHISFIDQQISDILNDLPVDSLAILAGDFNTNSNSETVRFIKGENSYNNSSTFWVDAWSETNNSSGFTFNPKMNNRYLHQTAIKSGILNPELMPPRRIDFIFIKGWVYGRPGCPIKTRILGSDENLSGNFASDHFGVYADIWDPI